MHWSSVYNVCILLLTQCIVKPATVKPNITITLTPNVWILQSQILGPAASLYKSIVPGILYNNITEFLYNEV